MKFAGTEHTSQVIALLINNAGINVKTESGVGGGGGTGKGAAFDSLPPTTRLPAELNLHSWIQLVISAPIPGGGGYLRLEKFLGGDVRLGHWNP